MRSKLVAMATVVLLLAVAAPSALADTVTAPADVYVVGGGFSFVDHSQTWSGYAQVEDDRLHGARVVSFYFGGPGAQKQCDAGTPGDPSDDFVGTDFIEFVPTSTRLQAFSVRSDLTTGKFSVEMAGARDRIDGCSGEIVNARPERHSFELALKSTSALYSQTDAVVIDNGNGTYSSGTSTYSYRNANGKASVDSRDAAVSDALIQHVLNTRN